MRSIGNLGLATTDLSSREESCVRKYPRKTIAQIFSATEYAEITLRCDPLVVCTRRRQAKK